MASVIADTDVRGKAQYAANATAIDEIQTVLFTRDRFGIPCPIGGADARVSFLQRFF
jgi:hypothetical protein